MVKCLTGLIPSASSRKHKHTATSCLPICLVVALALFACLQLSVRQMTASLRYPATDEEEDVDLTELLRDKCIAVGAHTPHIICVHMLLTLPLCVCLRVQ